MSYDIDITKTPPAHEPERQYYYMAKAKDFVEKKSKEIGRPMTYFVKTFGCQMNARDSEKLVGILEQIGYVEGTDEHSDFIVYNTCTVRENANNKVYGRLGYLQNYKKKNPLMKIALCGCMMQEPEVVENIKKHYKFVDIVFGTHNIFKFAEILCNNMEGYQSDCRRSAGEEKVLFQIRCQYHVWLQQFLQLLYRAIRKRS